jgi:hypothetical protein
MNIDPLKMSPNGWWQSSDAAKIHDLAKVKDILALCGIRVRERDVFFEIIIY